MNQKLLKEALQLNPKNKNRLKGWRLIGQGAFKTVYRKQDIVVKIGRHLEYNDHLEDEVYLYHNLDKKDKKYFAKIYCFQNNRIIQNYIPKSKRKLTKYWNIITKLGIKYNIQDYHRENVYIYKNRPIFIDYGL